MGTVGAFGGLGNISRAQSLPAMRRSHATSTLRTASIALLQGSGNVPAPAQSVLPSLGARVGTYWMVAWGSDAHACLPRPL